MSCKHFGICGGCRLQDIPYPEQLALKEKKIAELALRGELNTTIKAINHFPFWYYRNKMEYTFSRDQGRLICGLHRQDQRRAVFNVEECPIFSEDLSVILNAVREFLASKNYAAYDTFTHQGFLRHLILRETKFTKQLMIALVTSSQDTLDEDGFLKSLQSVSLQNKIHSIFRITNDSFGDAVVFQQKKCLYQDDFIKENLDGISFRVYVDSFFQTNPHGITSLYRKLVDYAPLTRQDKVFDFFCGMGTITLFLASKADFIWGVELEKSAVAGAQENAADNGVTNVSFIASDVRTFLGKNNYAGKITLTVINPPRCGLSKKVKKRLVELGAPYLFYSSCNPVSFFEDVKDLSSCYRVEFIEPFDFFPHTPHVEIFAFLKRNT